MRAQRGPNQQLQLVFQESGWTGEQFARSVNLVGAEAGIRLEYQRASVTQWLGGTRPRHPVPQLMAEALSRRLGRRVTVADIGLEQRPSTCSPPPWWVPSPADALVESCRAADLGSRRQDTLPYRVDALALPEWGRLPTPSTGEAQRRGSAGIGRDHVDDASAMLVMFSDNDLRFGGGHVRRALLGYLRTTIAPWLAAKSAPTTRGRLLVVAARLCYLSAFTHFDDEMHGAAQRLYLTSLRLAAEGGDAAAYTAALRALSVQASRLDHRQEAVRLAEMAVNVAEGRTSPGVHAFLFGQLAAARAARGDRRDALTALTAAEKYLARAEHCSSGIALYHSASFLHQKAITLARLGDRATAIQLLKASLRNRPDQEKRSRLITRAHLAEFEAGEGRLEQACLTWHHLLDDYPEITCRRADTALRTMQSRLRSYRKSPAARALLMRTAELTSTSASSSRVRGHGRPAVHAVS